MSDFLTSDNNPIGSAGTEEEKQKDIFVKASAIEENKSYGFTLRYFCSTCRRSKHNRPNNQKICRGKGCDCACQFYYIGRSGRTLFRYGEKDTSKLPEFTTAPPSKAWVKTLEHARKALKKE